MPSSTSSSSSQSEPKSTLLPPYPECPTWITEWYHEYGKYSTRSKGDGDLAWFEIDQDKFYDSSSDDKLFITRALGVPNLMTILRRYGTYRRTNRALARAEAVRQQRRLAAIANNSTDLAEQQPEENQTRTKKAKKKKKNKKRKRPSSSSPSTSTSTSTSLPSSSSSSGGRPRKARGFHLKTCDGGDKHVKCSKRATHGSKKDGKRRTCGKHKRSNYVNLKSKRCEFYGCTKQPSYGFESDRKSRSCVERKYNCAK